MSAVRPSHGARQRVLFVTWDGPEVNYLETLFLPIFSRLSCAGFDFQVLQFTWGDPIRVDAIRRACLDVGVQYQAKQVCRRPVAAGSVFAAIAGAFVVRQIITRDRIDIVMPRATLPALTTLLAVARDSIPVVFDADGLPIDERVDFAGLRRAGAVYRLLRNIERQAVRKASVVLTRSNTGIDILRERAGRPGGQREFRVVRNGRDTDLFSPGDGLLRARTREHLGIEETSPLVVYAGSLGPKYCLVEMLELFSFIKSKSPRARLLVLTGSLELVKEAVSARKHLGDSVITKHVRSDEVPIYLAAADLGLALIRPSFSVQGVAPVKLGEYLLCGLPVVATEGIGDTDAILTPEVGFMTRKMDDSELERAADWFLGTVIPDREGFRSRSREAGLRDFSLDSAVEDYRHALELASAHSAR